jgi:hypothetical protein
MIQAASSVAARQAGRHFVKVSSNYRTEFIGARTATVENSPEAFLIEMPPVNTIPPHFHQVDQYQVFVAGAGTLGRHGISLIGLHYVDHHTAYGPINSGALGLSFFTIRTKSDPGAIFLQRPDHKDFLKPTKKRYLMADHIGISTELALKNRTDVALENVFPEADQSDGFGSYVLRMGPDMQTQMDPSLTGGQFILVVNGSLRFSGGMYPEWSTIYGGPNDVPPQLNSGADGLEALVLNFPRAG